MRSRLIAHSTKSSSSPVDLFAHYFLVHSIISINYGLSPIVILSSTYTINNGVPSPFTLCKIQLSVLNYLYSILRVITLMYYLNQKRDDCNRPQIDLISVSISSYA